MKSYRSILLLIQIILLLSAFYSFGGDLNYQDKDDKDIPNPNGNSSITGLNYKSKIKVREYEGYPNPFVTIQLGGFWAYNNASIQLNPTELQGTDIDLEKDFDLSQDKVFPRADVIFRLGKRHQIALSYFNVSRKKTLTLERDITFDDTTFYVNSSLRAKFKLISYGLDYRFSIIKSPVWELGLSLGAKLFYVYGSARATLNDFSYGVSKDYYAPVPLPGVHALVNLGKHVVLRGTADYFQLSVNDWDFKVWEVRPGIEFYPITNVGIGLYYHYLSAHIEKVPSDELNGFLKYRFNAATAVLSLRF